MTNPTAIMTALIDTAATYGWPVTLRVVCLLAAAQLTRVTWAVSGALLLSHYQ